MHAEGSPTAPARVATERAIHIAITHGPRQRDFLRLGVLEELLGMVSYVDVLRLVRKLI